MVPPDHGHSAALAPVLGARLAGGMGLAQPLAILTFSLTGVVIVLIGLEIPHRLHRFTDRTRVRTTW